MYKAGDVAIHGISKQLMGVSVLLLSHAFHKGGGAGVLFSTPGYFGIGRGRHAVKV